MRMTLAYSKTINGVSDGTHLMTTSFIKTKDKMRDQLLKNFTYCSKLMCTNINGLKIHPVSTNNPLPILTSAKDANMPTTGTKVRNYFLFKIISHSFPECATNQSNPYRKLMQMDASNLMRIDSLRVPIELQE
jgi:hypothetical protein